MYEAYFYGTEGAAIRCGWRRVEVVKLGKAWVTLKFPGRKRNKRIRRSVWDMLKKREVEP